MTVVGLLVLAGLFAGVFLMSLDAQVSPRAGRFGPTQPKGINL